MIARTKAFMIKTESHLIQLRLEYRVEVLGPPDGHEAVGVCQLGEDADLVVVLEVGADHGHGDDDGIQTKRTLDLRMIGTRLVTFLSLTTLKKAGNCLPWPTPIAARWRNT